MVVYIQKLSSDATVPRRGTTCAAGYDLYSSEDCMVGARSSVKVPTGIAIRLPDGCYGSMRSRSGLSFKNDIEVGAGVIDSDYSGEIKIHLYNHGDVPVFLPKQSRIAQLIIQEYKTVVMETVEELPAVNSTREGGFGSTGLN